MPEDRASRDGLLYLKEEELRSVLRNVPISDVYCVEDTVFARGKFATVRRALHKTTGVQYAAKYIKKRRRNVNMVPEIYHEISVLLKCASNNRVVRLYEVFETNSDMVLILGLAAGGELQRIFDGDQCLGEIEARRAMRQILEGLCYLHERNIAHLDLKPQNILLTVEDSCDDIKLCDFGISRVLEPGMEVRTLSGTPDYVAPEVVSYEPLSLATDIWSVGVLAYVLLSGLTPFGADTKEQTSLNISKGIVTFDRESFEDVSNVALDFIKSILVLNPKQRPTVIELLQHPWITPQNHILPPLSLKTTSDAISVTPKSTPIIQRKSLSLPPLEAPFPPTPSPNGNNTRTTFSHNGDSHHLTNGTGSSGNEEIAGAIESCNENHKEGQNDLNEHENKEEQQTTYHSVVQSINESLMNFCHNMCNENEAASPSEVLSEVSSEENEENFFLLKPNKFYSNEELYTHVEESQTSVNEMSNDVHAEFTIVLGEHGEIAENCLYKSCEDLLSDSGIAESEAHQNELSDNVDSNTNSRQRDSYLSEMADELQEEISEITINFDIPLNNEYPSQEQEQKNFIDMAVNIEEVENFEQKTFVNTLEVDKQILYALNYTTTVPDNSNDINEKDHSHLDKINNEISISVSDMVKVTCDNKCMNGIDPAPIQISSITEATKETEEIEFVSGINKLFVNTYKHHEPSNKENSSSHEIMEISLIACDVKEIASANDCFIAKDSEQYLKPIEVLEEETKQCKEIEYAQDPNQIVVNTYDMNETAISCDVDEENNNCIRCNDSELSAKPTEVLSNVEETKQHEEIESAHRNNQIFVNTYEFYKTDKETNSDVDQINISLNVLDVEEAYNCISYNDSKVLSNAEETKETEEIESARETNTVPVNKCEIDNL